MKRVKIFDIGYHTVETYEDKKRKSFRKWRDNKTGRFVKIPEED